MIGECYICGAYGYVEKHHPFSGTANRRLCEEDGITFELCPNCHRNAKHAAHNCRETDLRLKEEAERQWIEKTGLNIEAFIYRYGKNYI